MLFTKGMMVQAARPVEADQKIGEFETAFATNLCKIVVLMVLIMRTTTAKL